MNNGWIGVDLDGTLAHYDGWRGVEHIGDPILPMVNRIQHWLSQGRCVKIFTARICDGKIETRQHIESWLVLHVGRVLEITNVKDYAMIELWDDRAIRVQFNVGEPCCGNTNHE